MGDSGKLYVSEAVIPVYKSLLPFADLITPNQYEVEYVSLSKIRNKSPLISNSQ